MSAASAGACLGFLVWNFHPAKVFMGDTGSLFLGGLVCALAFAIDMPILLIPIGIIYIAEELSVILQVSYFKITHGKRLFKMSLSIITLKCAVGARLRLSVCSVQ